MPNSNVPITPGTGTNIDTYQLGSGGDHRQIMLLGDHGGFNGRFTTYRTPGRAGTTGQNLAALWNATGSTVLVDCTFIGVDLVQSVVKVVTVEAPIIRIMKLTTIPSSGTAGFKVATDSGNTASNASVSTFQDASGENTSSTTALGFTQTTAASGLTQEFAPRLLAIGTTPATNVYEMADRVEFLQTTPVTLRAGEGIGVRLEYNTATMNPTTDKWIVTMLWEEYQP